MMVFWKVDVATWTKPLGRERSGGFKNVFIGVSVELLFIPSLAIRLRATLMIGAMATAGAINLPPLRRTNVLFCSAEL
jgi:hypothetical protein